MIADYFTKPLQGGLFTKFQNLIMNVAPSHTSELEPKECVEVSVPIDEEWTLVTRKQKDRKSDTM